MLEKAFNDVYTKFKLHFYQNAVSYTHLDVYKR